MVLIPNRSVRWGCNNSIYILKAGIEIEVKESDLVQAKASGLFQDVVIKEKDSNVKPIKRKTASKLIDIE